MVVPIILGVAVAVLAIGWLITWYRQPPKEENSTIREIKKRIEQVEEDRKTSELKRERDKLAAEMEKKRKQLKEMEEKEKEERKRKETEKKEQEERKREETEKKEQEERQRQEEKQRQENKLEGKVVESKKEEKTAEKPTEEKHEKPTQGKPTEEPAMTEQQFELFRQLQDYEAQMKAKEKELRKQMKRAHVSADTEEAARLRLESGLQPIKWPTADEFHRGRELVQYNPSNVHFAIVGKSGSGKSSLINAFLNLRKGEPGAAATGVTETTATIGRYQDPGQQAPRPWTVWYDVPGAGTQNVSAWQYFINQGLFVFDVILIAIGDRFEETDVQLLRDCHRFKIPALIVRSKADMHIDNLIKEDGGWGESVKREIYQRCRDTFITESKQMVRDELVKAELDDQEVYLVSSYTLRQVYNRSLDGLEDGLPSNVIDEKTLIRDLMLRTVQRRCGDSRAFQAALEIATQGVRFFPSFTMYLRIIQLTMENFIHSLPSLEAPSMPDKRLAEHFELPDARTGTPPVWTMQYRRRSTPVWEMQSSKRSTSFSPRRPLIMKRCHQNRYVSCLPSSSGHGLTSNDRTPPGRGAAGRCRTIATGLHLYSGLSV